MILSGLKDKLFSGQGGIRDTLFGDMPLEVWGAKAPDCEPWVFFAEAQSALAAGDKQKAIDALGKVITRSGWEARHYAQAWHFLRQLGRLPAEKDAKLLLGVVVEVALDQGLDLLAGYADYTARYYNYSGGGVVWEHIDASLDKQIDALLAVGRKLVAEIGPWEKERLPPPPKGEARISLLTPSGIHFGQGGLKALAADELSGPVMQSALQLMQALIHKAENKPPQPPLSTTTTQT